jgi:hypothetical protein
MEWKARYATRSDQDEFELDSLLHPAQAFAHPNDVVNDPDLTLNEKRNSCLVGVGCLRHRGSTELATSARSKAPGALR